MINVRYFRDKNHKDVFYRAVTGFDGSVICSRMTFEVSPESNRLEPVYDTLVELEEDSLEAIVRSQIE